MLSDEFAHDLVTFVLTSVRTRILYYAEHLPCTVLAYAALFAQEKSFVHF